MFKNFYHFPEETNVPSPQLVYYLDQIKANIEKTIREAGGAEFLWPHVKTHKMADMIRLQLSYGIKRFKCATIAEAEMAASCGADAVILAYPLVGPNIARFLTLRKTYPDTLFLALEDDLGMLKRLSEAADGPIPYLVDVNPGFYRTGVKTEDLPAFLRSASSVPNVECKGFHVYDGQNHQSDLAARQQAVDACEEAFFRVYRQLQEEGLSADIVVFGGTPSMPCFAPKLSKYPHAWLSPGTLFVNDYGYASALPDMVFPPAAALLTRVVSHPRPGCFTLDLGTKAVSTDQAVPGLLLDMEAEPLVQSEEHWAFRMKEGHEEERPSIGDVLYVLPSHICPTTALYPEVPVIENGHLSAVWPVTARNRKITI